MPEPTSSGHRSRGQRSRVRRSSGCHRSRGAAARKKATMTTRTAGACLAAALVAGSTWLLPDPAAALPPGAPATGMVCTPGTVSGGAHTFNLVAKTGYVDTPDGNSIFMWSYANADAPDSGQFQSPGPVLCATQGETVEVNLTNTLPEASSVV